MPLWLSKGRWGAGDSQRAREIIKKIYGLYLEGASLTSIADQLSHEGILTYTGLDQWNSSTISSILKNEAYMGDVIRQKSYSVDSISQKRKKNSGELPQYYFEDHHAPIIGRETFSLVQEEYCRRKKKCTRLSENRPIRGRYSSKYQLSNLMVCGQCGCRYYRCHCRNEQVVWRCSNRLKLAQNCDKSPTVNESQLREMLLIALNKYVAEHNVRELFDSQYREKVGSVDILDQKIEQIMTQLRQDISIIRQNSNMNGAEGMDAFNRVLRILVQSIQLFPKNVAYVFPNDVKITIQIV